MQDVVSAKQDEVIEQLRTGQQSLKNAISTISKPARAMTHPRMKTPLHKPAQDMHDMDRGLDGN